MPESNDKATDYRLIAGICNELGIRNFTIGQIDDLVKLCREYAARKEAKASK